MSSKASLRETLREKIERGEWKRKAPFGYRSSGLNKPHVIDEAEQAVIKQVLELSTEMRIGQIVGYLNRDEKALSTLRARRHSSALYYWRLVQLILDNANKAPLCVKAEAKRRTMYLVSTDTAKTIPL